MKKYKLFFVFIFGFFLAGCSGISKTPSENEILSDLSEFFPSQAIECTDSLVINKSQLFTDEKEWNADVVISASNKYAHMSAKVTVVYDYYDDKGWIINIEKTKYPVFAVEKTVSGMTDDDIQNLLDIWVTGQVEYIDSLFDEDNSIEQITYKIEKQESSFYNSVTYGILECCYYGPDKGWSVINDVEESKDFFPIVENIVGTYDGTCYAGGWDWDPRFLGYYNFNITDISQDGKNLTINGYKREFDYGNLTEPGDVSIKVDGENQIIMRQGQDYYAELVEYKQEGASIEAVYEITDLEVNSGSNQLIICTSSDSSGEWEYLRGNDTVSEVDLHIQMLGEWFWKS